MYMRKDDLKERRFKIDSTASSKQWYYGSFGQNRKGKQKG